jgi:hypothetical protein
MIPTTELLGFSQTYQWYTGQSFSWPIADPTFAVQQRFLSTYAVLPTCQARFGFGGDLSRWKDEAYTGYEGHVVHAIQKDRREVTRLIFQVSGEPRSPEVWGYDILVVIKILLKKYPNLRELYLQPVIGGQDPQSKVRAVTNHPFITAAIKSVVNKTPDGLLRVGAVATLDDSDFSDAIGHLTSAGAQNARALILPFYNLSF